jgi:toxin ParE1/3/4
VRLADTAEADIENIYAYVSVQSSHKVARDFIDRIMGFISGLDMYPERGTVRSEIRAGLRIIGFERRINVAFVVEEHDVAILRVLYGGQQFEE